MATRPTRREEVSRIVLDNGASSQAHPTTYTRLFRDQPALDVIQTLLELDSSREPSNLTHLLNSFPYDISIARHGELWVVRFPLTLLEIILDKSWYHPLDSVDDGSSVLSEQSIIILKLLHATVVCFNNLLVGACHIIHVEQLCRGVQQFLQLLPSLFEIFWRYRSIMLCITRAEEVRLMFPDIQDLVGRYYYLYQCVYRSSPTPPLTFVVHVGFYCWFHSTNAERKFHGMASYVGSILEKAEPAKCKAFGRETVRSVLGPQPAGAIGRILRTDDGLTDTTLLKVTVDLVGMLICADASIVKNALDLKMMLRALAMTGQRHICRCHEDRGLSPDILDKNRQYTSMTILKIIWILRSNLGANEVRVAIATHLNYFNFLPQIARCIALTYIEDDGMIMDCIAFFVDIYKTVGNLEQSGRFTKTDSAEYSNLRRVLQIHWQPVLNELQSATTSLERQAGPRTTRLTKLRIIRKQWQELGVVFKLDGELSEHFLNENETLGCYNVECPCYGHKPLHKLQGKCKRCQVARYCNRECQKKDWKAEHRLTCSSL
ncbi:hypothetical protein BDY19DRAFT_395134 [Irpex rosettiformis]|uniref:Uncharacterized protein n=1 Tax=Irpex rosettiformis TaxID=378272 RepID=A0ACB8TUW5_9APHY|nr:hypothetical protein BDY19DRAFT_395134 [Irpex rosettiformis]